LPADWVVRLDCATVAVDALFASPPLAAPALVRYRPAGGGRADGFVADLLDAVDRAARCLFPVWLPGAEHLAGVGSDVAAARALAVSVAARGRHFGPFLADLAVRSLTGSAAGRGRLPAETRALGLARVVADSFERSAMVLVVDVPDGLAPLDQEGLVAGCEWFARHGECGVWLVGAPLLAVDRLRSVVVASEADTIGRPEVGAGEVSIALIAGRPRADSRAETALERALAMRPWAAGRTWNQTYQLGSLANPVRLDLAWLADGLVVEVDGPEHRLAAHYENDRRRDVDLHLAGLRVLRFTNAQVEEDLAGVLERIERMLHRMRTDE
jgi:very-short-patch-repair endonuclease